MPGILAGCFEWLSGPSCLGVWSCIWSFQRIGSVIFTYSERTIKQILFCFVLKWWHSMILHIQYNTYYQNSATHLSHFGTVNIGTGANIFRDLTKKVLVQPFFQTKRWRHIPISNKSRQYPIKSISVRKITVRTENIHQFVSLSPYKYFVPAR